MEMYEDDRQAFRFWWAKQRKAQDAPQFLISWFQRYLYIQGSEASYVWEKGELCGLVSGHLEPMLSVLERSLWVPAFLL